MRYQIRDRALVPEKGTGRLEEGVTTVVTLTRAEALEEAEALGLPHRLVTRALGSGETRFESHESLDMMCLPLTAGLDSVDSAGPETLHLFLRRDLLCIVCDGRDLVAGVLRDVREDSVGASPGRILFLLFDRMFATDSDYLDRLEDEVMDLEDGVLQDRQGTNCVRDIITHRKRLLKLRRYYGKLLRSFSFLNLNENRLLDGGTLKLLKIAEENLRRLYDTVQELMEHVTQIREAYQAQVDIRLNNTMRLLTVITLIFSPLTLIAGWYGMNFDMPEFHTPWGYPVILTVSIVILIALLWYCKKRKWF